MLRLYLLSLALTGYQGSAHIHCSCRNGVGEPVVTSHHSLSNGEWITSINGDGRFCDSNTALQLWNFIISAKCMRRLPTPSSQIYKRPMESEMIKKGYAWYGRSLYKFHYVTKDWENARRTCMSEGAHLAVVNTKEEAKVLEFIFARYPYVADSLNNNYALVGFHDQFTEGNYLTIFGEPIQVAGYSKWEPLNPDNLGRNNKGHPGQNCGSINRNGTLNDVECCGRFAFFCELEDSYYPPFSETDYSAGYYTGVEDVIKPRPGYIHRFKPSSGYMHYPGVGFYKMHTRPNTWENARRTCESENAHLAIINSEKESAALSIVFSKHKRIYNALSNDFALIGFHDQYVEGEFLTIYNETLKSAGFDWWNKFEPNNNGATKVVVGEDCGAVDRSGKLNDVSCHMRFAFICEQPLLE